MADAYIFTMMGLNKHYGQKHVLRDISLSFFPGAKIGIVGENGAGKSTVLRIMAGEDDDFDGEAQLTRGYSVGYVPQEPELDPDMTVRQSLEESFAETRAMLAEFDEVTAKMGEDLDEDEMQAAMDRMGELQETLDARDAWNLDRELERAADALCLPADDRIISTLSGGERRRVALCQTLLRRPDLLLLDEPTNHLDAETIDWLEAQLRDYPGTVIVVTHDRYFLDNVTAWILELDNGHGVPWKGNYSSWLEQKLARLAQGQKKDSPRRRALQRELDWIRMSNRDRRELTQKRVSDYEQLLAREEAADKGDSAVIRIAPGPALGDQVIDVQNVAKRYNGDELIRDLSFNAPRGAVVGIVGPNGTGKTTLLRMLVGQEEPDDGKVEIGQTVRFSYVDQGRELVGDKPLLQEVCEGDEVVIGRKRLAARQYVALFGFTGMTQDKPISQLSGGERNRCYLAKTLRTGGNVLLLDEPTNDLDVNTLRLLEEAIAEFAGCTFVVSHDRFFLNRVCTHLLVFEGEGQVRWFQGNYEAYENWRIEEKGEKPFENRRSKYRKIVKS